MDGNKLAGRPVTEEELLQAGYRKYIGKKISIFYSKDICAHFGECVRGNPQVFEVGRKPWIIADNGEPEETIRVIDRCPSGALKYMRKDEMN